MVSLPFIKLASRSLSSLEGITCVYTWSVKEIALGATEELSLEMKNENKNYQSAIPIVGAFDDNRDQHNSKIHLYRSTGVRYRELLRFGADYTN